MKILILAPLERKITPKITAARPRVIFDLVSELIKMGQKVSILGTRNSKVAGAEIIPVIEKGFYEMSGKFENPFYAWVSFLVRQAAMAQKISGKFDVIHNHSKPEFINVLAGKNFKAPMLSTLHLPITKEADQTLSLFPEAKLVCNSRTAKKAAKKTKIFKVINLGVDSNIYKLSEKKDDYLLWLGRLSQAKDEKGEFMDPKGVKWAIQLAERTNSRLILSGNVEDQRFFNKEVKPHLNSKIKWRGRISFEQPLSKLEVARLMAGARALLMTTQLEETFGLVMAEAMSCGTPVIAFNKGAVPEVVQHEKTGFVVKPNDIKEMERALNKIETIEPKKCRQWVEKKFTIKKMAENYLNAYQELK